MKEQADKIQAVINTLEELDIKSTYDNMNKILGCMQMLAGIRDDLGKEAPNGNADAE